MNMPQRFFQSHSLRNLLFVLILASIILSLGYVADRFRIQSDLTFNAINSLEPESIKLLKEMDGPVNITVYATEQDARLGDIRKIIGDFISLYQRYKPDIKLVFIDPSKNQAKARTANIRYNGEMVIEYSGRSVHLTKINEPILSSTLLQLMHTRDKTVMYLEGHGERKLDGIANYDLGSVFGAKLKQNGFNISSLNLTVAQEVPENVSVLVVTQPQIDLFKGEVNKLLRYIDKGGNLLWLIDAEPLRGLKSLAEKLELQLPPGVVIDPGATRMNAPPTWSLGSAYPPHAITRSFNMITAFPSARPLIWNEDEIDSNKQWKHNVLVEAAARGWVSRRKQTGNNPVFDKKNDIPGPAVIALAMHRTINDHEQRIVVVGNGAFLDNSHAGNGGNVDLGINMVNWLASEERFLNLHPKAAEDSQLVMSKLQLEIISAIYLVILPLLLITAGIFIWRKRRA